MAAFQLSLVFFSSSLRKQHKILFACIAAIQFTVYARHLCRRFLLTIERKSIVCPCNVIIVD